MKNPIYIIFILIIIAAGVWLVLGQDGGARPEISGEENDVTSAPMPAPGFENVPEMVVNPSGEITIKEFTISGQDFSYSPTEIAVKKGDTVRITFKNTNGFHDWVIDEYNVSTPKKPAPAEETVEFVADKTGRFEFYCSVGEHRELGMKGALIVTE